MSATAHNTFPMNFKKLTVNFKFNSWLSLDFHTKLHFGCGLFHKSIHNLSSLSRIFCIGLIEDSRPMREH